MKKHRVTLQRGLTGWGYERTREIVIQLPEGLTPEDVVERLEDAYHDTWKEDLADWDLDDAEIATSEEVDPDTPAELVFDNSEA